MKYIHSLIFCLTLLQATKSNDFYVTTSSQWVYCFRDSLGSPFFDYNVYNYLKDTVVQGRVCKFIECNNSKYDVIVYEDDQKLFYFQNETFKLLYDFSAQEKDTVYLDIRAVSFRIVGEQLFLIDTTLSVKSIVSRIDSLQVSDTIFLKRITANIYPKGADFLNNSVWPETISYIEKLGYLSDGFIPRIILGFSIDVNHDRDLRCYSEGCLNYISDFWKQLSSDCYYQTRTSLPVNEVAKIDFYPNPFNDIVNISINHDTGIKDGIWVELFDYTGKLINKSFFQYGKNIQVSLNHLQKGMYLISLRDQFCDEIFYTDKLIKQ